MDKIKEKLEGIIRQEKHNAEYFKDAYTQVQLGRRIEAEYVIELLEDLYQEVLKVM